MNVRKLVAAMLAVLMLSVAAPTAFAEADSTWDQVKAAGSNLWDKTKEKAPQLWEKTKDKASEVYDKAKEKAPAVYEKAKDGLHNAQEKVSDWRQEQEDEFWEWEENQLYGDSQDSIEETTPDSTQAEPDAGSTDESASDKPETTTNTEEVIAQSQAQHTPQDIPQSIEIDGKLFHRVPESAIDDSGADSYEELIINGNVYRYYPNGAAWVIDRSSEDDSTDSNNWGMLAVCGGIVGGGLLFMLAISGRALLAAREREIEESVKHPNDPDE